MRNVINFNNSLIIIVLWTTISCSFPSLNNENRREIAGTKTFLTNCQTIFYELFSNVKKISQTKIEQLLTNKQKQMSVSETLTERIRLLEQKDSKLASSVRKARRDKERGIPLKIDLSYLPSHMVNFINGTYTKVVGARGISRPFMTFTSPNETTLIIHHLNDKYPLMIKWKENHVYTGIVTDYRGGETIYKLLELPRDMITISSQKLIEKKHIYKLISGSRLNKYISSRDSLIMQISSLLHHNKLIFDRPGQRDFTTINNLIQTNKDVKNNVRSLLFVAPTATGKTRIIANAIKSKIIYSSKRFIEFPNYQKKLSILMANSPDLVGQLAMDIGEQLHYEIGKNNYRIIQWGGSRSDNIRFNELVKFIKNSDKPVLLVTSSQTLAARIKNNDDLTTLLNLANLISVDEAHNSSGKTFKRVMNIGMTVATNDRISNNIFDALDIIGVTASPITKYQRTIELYDVSYWASIDTPTSFKNNVTGINRPPWNGKHKNVLEWLRMNKQYVNARDRGELNAPENRIFFDPQRYGFKFRSIFKRASKGTHSNVDIVKLKKLWPIIDEMIDGHGQGIINAYPRDAEILATTLSDLTGKNFVSLENKGTKERSKIYKAFKHQTLYKDKKIDAIVGKIREGMNFPDAGWFLSFKKYVRFPETLQAEGRVVRLSLDKLSPVIIYFGEEIEAMIYKDIRDLVLRRMGRLVRKFGTSRKFRGARHSDPNIPLGKVIGELNASIEALFRIKYDLTRNFGNYQSPNKEVVSELQNIITKIRRQKSNIEIAESIDKFIYEINSYPFYKGDLKSTWRYCRKILSAYKKGKPYPKRFTEDDILIVEDQKLMKMITEFKNMYSWIGPVPRAILETMDLRPLNVYQTAEAVNVFINNHNRIPWSTFPNPKSLESTLKDVLSSSPETFWSRLNHHARMVLEDTYLKQKHNSFETLLTNYYHNHDTLPRFAYDKIEVISRDIDDDIGHKLSARLDKLLRTGRLELNLLDDRLLEAIDSSGHYHRILKEISFGIEIAMSELLSKVKNGTAEIPDSSIFTIDYLLNYNEFGILKILKSLKDLNYENSVTFYTSLEDLLSSYFK